MSETKTVLEILEADLKAFEAQYVELNKAEQQIAAEKAKLEQHFRYVTNLKLRLEQMLKEPVAAPEKTEEKTIKEQLEQAFVESASTTKVVERHVEIPADETAAAKSTEEVKMIKDAQPKDEPAVEEPKKDKKPTSTKTATVTKTKVVKPEPPAEEEDWGDNSSNTSVFSEEEEDEWASTSASATSRTTNANADAEQSQESTPVVGTSVSTSTDDEDDWGS